jgi:hypothetical protein
MFGQFRSVDSLTMPIRKAEFRQAQLAIERGIIAK